MLYNVTNPAEVSEMAVRLRATDWHSRDYQVNLLTGLLNGGVDFIRAFGVAPLVTGIYPDKMTDSPKRVGGVDYRRIPGQETAPHSGLVTRAWRGADGHLVLTISDLHRVPTQPQPGQKARKAYTCMRLEGIVHLFPGTLVQPGALPGLTAPGFAAYAEAAC